MDFEHILHPELVEHFLFMTEMNYKEYRELTFENIRRNHLEKSNSLLRRSILFPLLQFRYKQFELSWRAIKNFSNRKLTLSQGNVCSALLFELLIGFIMMCLFHYWISGITWTNLLVNYTDKIIKDINELLILLKSMPAGLKLNRSLNMALSQFFLYHNHLWKTYIDFLQPYLHFLNILTFCSGLIGFTTILRYFVGLFTCLRLIFIVLSSVYYLIYFQ